jgi:predicted membrane protein
LIHDACKHKLAGAALFDIIDGGKAGLLQKGYWAPKYTVLGKELPPPMQFMIVDILMYLTSGALLSIFSECSRFQREMFQYLRFNEILGQHSEMYEHDCWAAHKNIYIQMFNHIVEPLEFLLRYNKSVESVIPDPVWGNLKKIDPLVIKQRLIVQNAFCLIVLWKVSLGKGMQNQNGMFLKLFPLEYITIDSAEYKREYKRSPLCIRIMTALTSILESGDDIPKKIEQIANQIATNAILKDMGKSWLPVPQFIGRTAIVNLLDQNMYFQTLQLLFIFSYIDNTMMTNMPTHSDTYDRNEEWKEFIIPYYLCTTVIYGLSFQLQKDFNSYLSSLSTFTRKPRETVNHAVSLLAKIGKGSPAILMGVLRASIAYLANDLLVEKSPENRAKFLEVMKKLNARKSYIPHGTVNTGTGNRIHLRNMTESYYNDQYVTFYENILRQHVDESWLTSIERFKIATRDGHRLGVVTPLIEKTVSFTTQQIVSFTMNITTKVLNEMYGLRNMPLMTVFAISISAFYYAPKKMNRSYGIAPPPRLEGGGTGQWETLYTDEGVPYYVNDVLGVTQWEAPR